MTRRPDWMLNRPDQAWNSATEAAFQTAFTEQNSSLLPADVPRWLFLDWLTRQGWLLHGTEQADLKLFEPRTPEDLSPDEFSKRTGVFAASEGLWAMMYALRDRHAVARMLNMATQIREGEAWSETRYYLSFAPRLEGMTDGRSLLKNGFIYVLPPGGFEQMPPYHWPGLGEIREPHWVNPEAVRPTMCVPVSPADFPLPVRLHDAARIDLLAQTDPWDFPWLNSARHSGDTD